MSDIGISTSCFYPMETERALEHAAALGFQNFELHPNTFSELSDGYLKELLKVVKYHGGQFRALHPFYSLLESPMFFSNYGERRFADGLEIYKQYFHATALLGAKYCIFHGGTKTGKSRCMVSDDVYCERYHMLYECAKKFGVTLLHENVYGYLAESMAFCRKLIEYLGDQALFTFDNKQARRAGFDAVEFASALSGHIRHIHISDYDATHDCLVPGRGNEDFAAMRAALSGDDETACWVIEVYEHVFHDPEDLRLSGNYLRSVLRGAQTI